MLAITGVVLLNAACILLVGNVETTEVYALTRILIGGGSCLLGVDFVTRFHAFTQRARVERETREGSV